MKLLGCYNKSVILTYIGLMCALLSILLCILSFVNIEKDTLYISLAMICLVLSFICDLYDGTIARKCKRSELEKLFGMQIDTLVDTVSFVVLPFILGIKFLNFSNIVWYIPLFLYVLAGIIRLSYFDATNVISRNKLTQELKYFGLPVTYVGIALPFIYIMLNYLNVQCLNYYYSIMLIVLAIAFVLPFKFPILSNIAKIILTIISLLLISALIFFIINVL